VLHASPYAELIITGLAAGIVGLIRAVLSLGRRVTRLEARLEADDVRSGRSRGRGDFPADGP